MPQTTISGYFIPIQPRPISVVASAETKGRFNDNPTETTTQDDTKTAEILRVAAAESALALSIREVLPRSDLAHDTLSAFVPVGRPQAAIVKVSASHTPRLKNITKTLLPVRYSDTFFNECLHDDTIADLSRVALWSAQPVGWIRCRLEEDDHGCKQVYIQALGVLALYRRYGLATSLLEQVIQPSNIQKYSITSIYCHVWESNHDALQWYERRGFKRIVLVEQYYRRLKPGGAWIMRRELG